jgi:glycine oxidase
MHSDLLILGGGVIGLSLADEAARKGLTVTLVDKGAFGAESSWAGAGMLTCRPHARRNGNELDYHDLTSLSVQLHARWAARLFEETGIDVGYRRCGALELVLDGDSDPDLAIRRAQEHAREASDRGIRAIWRTPEEARRIEAGISENCLGAIEFPDEAQVRNPRLVKGLLASVERKNVRLIPNAAMTALNLSADESACSGATLANGESLSAGNTVLCMGAWTGGIGSSVLNRAVPELRKIEPVRGQLLRYDVPRNLATRLLTVGNHYIVPRGDGVLLVGATHEKVGFEKTITDSGREELRAFGARLLPALRDLPIVGQWAGLRPGLKGRHPILGPVPGVAGLWLNAGHYRNGLTLAPVSAELVSEHILTQTCPILSRPWLPS